MFVGVYLVYFVLVEYEGVVGFQLVDYDLFEQIDCFDCVLFDVFVGYYFGVVVVEIVLVVLFVVEVLQVLVFDLFDFVWIEQILVVVLFDGFYEQIWQVY